MFMFVLLIQSHPSTTVTACPMRLVFSPTTAYLHYSIPNHIIFLSPPLRRWRTTLMASASREKIIVIMGATGTGKSRLSIDLATRLFPGCSEIINSDKMQVYKGLDITTNKIPFHQRQNVPHHFLGEFDPLDGELTPSEFRQLGEFTISDIISRQKTPFVVGGSNSLIYSLLVENYDGADSEDVFNSHSHSPSCRLRYDCCFLWVDASLPVLFDYVEKRVDEMLESGMFEELSEYFESAVSRGTTGLSKAIGVPEFERCFARDGDGVAYEEAVREIKENTCELVKRQIGKILKLRGAGWDLRRLDATAAFKSSDDDEEWKGVWERDVVEAGVKIVKRFLEE